MATQVFHYLEVSILGEINIFRETITEFFDNKCFSLSRTMRSFLAIVHCTVASTTSRVMQLNGGYSTMYASVIIIGSNKTTTEGFIVINSEFVVAFKFGLFRTSSTVLRHPVPVVNNFFQLVWLR